MGGRGGSSNMNGGYTSFGDVMDGNNPSFTGDGSEQDAFFRNNSNYSELIDNMDWEHNAAFADWTNGAWTYGQQYEGWDNMSPEERYTTQLFDDVLDQSTLDKGVILSRRSDAQLVLGKGNTSATLEQLKAAEGATITSKGNMSFSAASQGLPMGSSGNIEYKLKIPRGSKGSGMYIGDDRVNDWGNSQREFMTNRDTSFRVGKTKYDASRGVHVVELQYLGRQPHDYGTKGRVRKEDLE